VPDEKWGDTPIGTAVPSGAIWLVTADGRQFRADGGVVVQEILPSSPLWVDRGPRTVHWSDWARTLAS
jgi:hypothetical protein